MQRQKRSRLSSLYGITMQGKREAYRSRPSRAASSSSSQRQPEEISWDEFRDLISTFPPSDSVAHGNQSVLEAAKLRKMRFDRAGHTVLEMSEFYFDTELALRWAKRHESAEPLALLPPVSDVRGLSLNNSTEEDRDVPEAQSSQQWNKNREPSSLTYSTLDLTQREAIGVLHTVGCVVLRGFLHHFDIDFPALCQVSDKVVYFLSALSILIAFNGCRWQVTSNGPRRE
jgi:hypothetical protein